MLESSNKRASCRPCRPLLISGRYLFTGIHMLNIRHLIKIMNYLVVVYAFILVRINVVSLHLPITFHIVSLILVNLYDIFCFCVPLYFQKKFFFMFPLSWYYSVVSFSLSLFTLYSDIIFLRQKISIYKELDFSSIYDIVTCSSRFLVFLFIFIVVLWYYNKQ